MNQKKPATLKSYGRAFQSVAMSSAADARIRRALDVQTPPPRRWWPLAWAVPIVVAAACLVLWQTNSDTSAGRGCEVTRESVATRYAGRCDVELSAMTVHLEPDATLVQQAAHVLLASGTAHFEVRKVLPGDPAVEVHVPEASIVVLGTEFTVTVTDHTSRVQLRSGRVRFVHEGHGAVEMWPGQELTFETKTGKTEIVTVSPAPSNAHELAATSTASSAPALGASVQTAEPPSSQNAGAVGNPQTQPRRRNVASPGAPSAPSPAPSAAVSSDLQVALDLRAQGRYDEALGRLEKVNPVGAHAREVVDFEQATLTELQAPQRACARYRQHLQRFPQSRYRAAVLQKLARCKDAAEAERPAAKALP